jgi:sulfonate transport system permease protein
MKSAIKVLLTHVWFPILCIFIWQLIQITSNNPFIPSISRIYSSLNYLIDENILLPNLFHSLTTLAIGYFIGSFLGVFFGTFLGSSKRALKIALPITNFIRCVPSIAKVPVVMALFGIGTLTRITIVAVAVFFPVLLGTLRAIANLDIVLLEHIRLLNYGKVKTLFTMKFPAAIGEILTTLQYALQLGILITIVSEMLGSGVGIGAFVIRSQSTFMIPEMWVGIIVVGIVGLTLNEIFNFLERKIAPWHFLVKGNQ